MNEVKVSSKNQIVIPLGAKAGSSLIVVTRNETVILMPKPKDYAKAIRGLAKKPYPRNYLKAERKAWR